MSSFTDYTENLALTYLFNTGAVTRPTAWYVGLFTAAPSDTGGGTEVTGNGYARVSAGTISGSGTATTFTNAAAIEFAAASGGNWGTIGCLATRSTRQETKDGRCNGALVLRNCSS